MILTGPVLKQRCQEILGKDWQRALARLGGFSRFTAWRWGQKKTGHTRAVKAKLLVAMEEQLRRTAALVQTLHDDLG